ncbi:MAG TPA: HmuY family protein [Polyangiaceae bacterium]|nr:HmuY family protein [Polyangiaceae bacterium]
MMRRFAAVTAVLALCSFACSDSVDSKLGPDAAGPDNREFDTGVELRVPVADEGRTFVKLSPPSIVVPAGDPAPSLDWDLAFEGFDVFTNGGASGTGDAAAFGPLDAAAFATGDTSQVPFLQEDKTGGAFLDWYAYEGDTHALFSRYHVYGVKDAGRLWKVQVLGYYGQRDGAAVAALYSIRCAEIGSDGVGPTRDEALLDGSAGGVAASPTAPNDCLDLASGARAMLTPDAARISHAWHLCFRRASIAVNGDTGGPRGASAVDLDAARTETLATIKAKTAETERPAFDAVTAAAFDGKAFRGDRVISAFSDLWVDPKSGAPVHAAWLIRDALGRQQFLLGFTSFENATAKSPATVVVRIKPARG